MPLPRCKCQRCGHEWVQRVENPRSCPSCHNINWDKKSERGSYDFARIEVGQEVRFPFYMNKEGLPDQKKGRRMMMAVHQYSFRTKRQFMIRSDFRGMFVKRVS